MKNSILFISLLLLNFVPLRAQTTLNFEPIFGNQAFMLNDSIYILNNKDTVIFENLKLYISNIELFKNDTLVFKEAESYHYIDFEKLNTLSFKLITQKPLDYNAIRFNLGIDSITNISGAMGGDLDPTIGMYWTWQSGYINFKLEGKSNLCKTRNNEFQFHLGGYSGEDNTLQTINLTTQNKDVITLLFDVKKFIETINFSQINHIMSPSKNAVILSRSAAKSFKIKE